jgi:DNA-binding transcriptional LysR family regulator
VAAGRHNWTTLQRIEAFCALGETGSWREATRRLLGNDAVEGHDDVAFDTRGTWQLVRDFSHDLFGDPAPALFSRASAVGGSGRHVVLTAEGEVVLEGVRRVLNAASALRNLALIAGRDGPLRLACFPAHVQAVVGKLMVATNIALQLEDDHTVDRIHGGEGLLQRLEAGETDAVIAPQGTKRQGVASEPLYEWELVVVGRQSRWTNETVHISELQREPLLLSPPEHGSREIVEALFRNHGFEPSVRHDSNSTEALLAHVDAGAGTAILPNDAVWAGEGRRVCRLDPSAGGIHSLHWREGEETSDPRLAALLAGVRSLRDIDSRDTPA